MQDAIDIDDMTAREARFNEWATGSPVIVNGDGIPHGNQADTPIDREDRSGTARKFLAELYSHPHGIALLRSRQTYYAYNGIAFDPVADDALRAYVRQFLDRQTVLVTVGKNEIEKPYYPNTHDVKEVIAATQDRTHTDIVAPAWRDGREHPDAKSIIACQNGLLDVSAAEPKLYKPTPRFFTTCAVPFDYMLDAPSPVLWLAFLNQIFEGNRESIEALQEWMGYVLLPDASQQKMMLLVGPPRSGKGTIARIIAAMLGERNVASPTLASLSQNFGLAPLLDKLLGIIGDARLSTRADQTIVLERLLSISGQDGITIDQKFRDPITTTLYIRLMLLTNELPKLNDPSGAVASRFIILMLRHSFLGKEDTELTARLMTELPGILNWSIDGLKRLRQRGHFVQPEAAREAIDELAAAVSPVRTFITDWCKVGPEQDVACDELYSAWRAWCDEQGKTDAGNVQRFRVDLRAALPSIEVRQVRGDDGRERRYAGIGLKLHAVQSAAVWRGKQDGR